MLTDLLPTIAFPCYLRTLIFESRCRYHFFLYMHNSRLSHLFFTYVCPFILSFPLPPAPPSFSCFRNKSLQLGTLPVALAPESYRASVKPEQNRLLRRRRACHIAHSSGTPISQAASWHKRPTDQECLRPSDQPATIRRERADRELQSKRGADAQPASTGELPAWSRTTWQMRSSAGIQVMTFLQQSPISPTTYLLQRRNGLTAFSSKLSLQDGHVAWPASRHVLMQSRQNV